MVNSSQMPTALPSQAPEIPPQFIDPSVLQKAFKTIVPYILFSDQTQSEGAPQAFFQGHSKLDIMDWIPVMSKISGVARMALGVVEIASAIPPYFDAKKKDEKASGNFVPFLNGGSNIMRGYMAYQDTMTVHATLFLYDRSPVLKSQFQKTMGVPEENKNAKEKEVSKEVQKREEGR